MKPNDFREANTICTEAALITEAEDATLSPDGLYTPLLPLTMIESASSFARGGGVFPFERFLPFQQAAKWNR